MNYSYINVDNIDRRERCTVIAQYIIEEKATVRAAAEKFGLSKSTVHKDVTVSLRRKNSILANEVKKVLEQNKLERHIRGGEATRKKYMMEQLTKEQSDPTKKQPRMPVIGSLN